MDALSTKQVGKCHLHRLCAQIKSGIVSVIVFHTETSFAHFPNFLVWLTFFLSFGIFLSTNKLSFTLDIF